MNKDIEYVKMESSVSGMQMEIKGHFTKQQVSKIFEMQQELIKMISENVKTERDKQGGVKI